MKKILTLLVIFMVAVTSWADTATDVKYIDANGVEQTCAEATIVTSSTSHVKWAAGWYVVQGTITLTQAVDCDGDVNLILADGAKLTVTGNSNYTAIYVGANNTLQIYGQTQGTGCLYANTSNSKNNAGIGGNAKAIIINGGTINAYGGDKGAAIGTAKFGAVGSITINGGKITAIGGSNAAGIGSACGKKYNSTTGDIVINGGTISATGGAYGAGIGGAGCDTYYDGICGNITITGGAVTATSGEKAAGIGGGKYTGGTQQDCGNITISGGNVTATGDADGSGIGCGNYTSCGNITITGGYINAAGGHTAYYDGHGIGGTYGSHFGKVTISTSKTIYQGSSANPTKKVSNNAKDLSSTLCDRYVIVNSDYLCFTAKASDTAIKFYVKSGNAEATLQYSKNGQAWKDYTYDTYLNMIAGDKIYFCSKNATNPSFSTSSIDIRFSATGEVAASGNIMSLLDSECKETTAVPDNAFSYLFYGCSYLTSAPTLPATTLGKGCYQSMFAGCTSLTAAPALSATTLTEKCYYNMFNGCTSLTSAPKLPAETLAESCYNCMFIGCTSLTTAPVLPAKTLVTDCYDGMFQNCSSLNSITVNFTDWNSGSCTNGWVSGVASSGTFTCPTALSAVATSSSETSYDPYNWTIAKGDLVVGDNSVGDQEAGVYSHYTFIPTKTALYSFTANKDNLAISVVDKDDDNYANIGYSSRCLLECEAGKTYTVNTSPAIGTKIEAVTLTIAETTLPAVTEGENTVDAPVELQANYTFTPATPGIYKFEISNVSDGARVFVSSKSGVYITTDKSASNSNGAAYLANVQTGNTYYLLVRAENGNAISDATLTISTIPAFYDKTNNKLYYEATELDNVNLVDGTENLTIGSNASRTDITSLDMNEPIIDSDETTYNVISIFDDAFSGVTSLEAIQLPSSLRFIGNEAFSGCTALAEAYLHSVPSIAELAFSGCTCKYFMELDDNSYVAEGSTSATAANYTRSMTNNWGTIVLPFATKSNDDVQLYTLTAVTTGEDGAMTFTATDDEIAANTPCVFKKKDADATSVTFTAENTAVSVAASPSYSTGVGNWTMYGTYENIASKDKVYFIAKNKFWYADDAISIAPFRAWFTSTSNAKSFNIVVDDEIDGISLTPAISQGEGVSKYLENGKVVIVRNCKKFNINGQEIK